MIRLVENIRDGNYWCRKYSDGWMEQGDYVEGTMSTDSTLPFVVFPIPFLYPPVNISTHLKSKDTLTRRTGALSIKTDANSLGASVQVTNTQFRPIMDSYGDDIVGFYWEARGLYK